MLYVNQQCETVLTGNFCTVTQFHRVSINVGYAIHIDSFDSIYNHSLGMKTVVKSSV